RLRAKIGSSEGRAWCEGMTWSMRAVRSARLSGDAKAEAGRTSAWRPAPGRDGWFRRGIRDDRAARAVACAMLRRPSPMRFVRPFFVFFGAAFALLVALGRDARAQSCSPSTA